MLLRGFERLAREVAEGERWKEVELEVGSTMVNEGMKEEGSSQASALVPYEKESRRTGNRWEVASTNRSSSAILL